MKPIEKFQIPNQLVTDFGVELVVDRVVKIDTDRKQIHTQNGQTYRYRHLVLATGSRPLVPPIARVELEGVTSVRSLQDLDALRGFAADGPKGDVPGSRSARSGGLRLSCPGVLAAGRQTGPQISRVPRQDR